MKRETRQDFAEFEREAARANGEAEWFGQTATPGGQPVRSAQAPARKTIKAGPFKWRDPTLIPRRQWVYPQTYVRKFVTATIAPGGIGKTGLSVVEALAMASGRDLLGDGFRDEPLRVWLWNGEDPIEEMERQVHAAIIHYGIKQNDIGDRLFLDSGRDMPIRVAFADKTGFRVDAESQSDITETIKENRIDAAVFDPLISIHKVPENSNEAMDAVIKALAQIASDTDCAMGIYVHTRKSQPGNSSETTSDDARGGGALVAGARITRVLNRMTKEEAERAGIAGNDFKRYFWQGLDKVNLTPPDEAKSWRHLESVYLPNGPSGSDGDNMRVVVPWRWPDPFSDVTTKDLLGFQGALAKEAERNRVSIQSPDWAGHLLGEVLGLDTGQGLKAKENLVPDQINARSKCGAILRKWQTTRAIVSTVIEDRRRNRMVPILQVGEWADT